METSTKPSSGFDASHFKEASMLKPSSNKKEVPPQEENQKQYKGESEKEKSMN